MASNYEVNQKVKVRPITDLSKEGPRRSSKLSSNSASFENLAKKKEVKLSIVPNEFWSVPIKSKGSRKKLPKTAPVSDRARRTIPVQLQPQPIKKISIRRLISPEIHAASQKSKTGAETPAENFYTRNRKSTTQRASRISNHESRFSTSTNKGKNKDRDSLLLHDVNSDYDIAYGRPKAISGYYFDLEWWWLQFAESLTHRTLVLLLAFLFTVGICHVVLAILIFSSSTEIGNPYLCTTPSCLLAVERITQGMTERIGISNETKSTSSGVIVIENACNDFYSFVCGNYVRSEEDFPDEFRSYNFSNSYTSNTYALNKIFERGALAIDSVNYNFKYSRSLGKMLRDSAKRSKHNKPLKFYKTCLNQKRRNQVGIQPYFDLLKKYDLMDIKPGKSLGKIIASLFRDFVTSTPIFRFALHFELKEYEIIRSIYPAVQSMFLYSVPKFSETMNHLLTHVGKELELGSPKQINELIERLTCVELSLFHFYGSERKKAEHDLGCPININLSNEEEGKAAKEYKTFFIELYAHEIPDIESWGLFNRTLNSVQKRHRTYLDRGISGMTQQNYQLALRFLQWRILIEYSGNLDEELFLKECPLKRVHKKCNRFTACFWSTSELFPQQITKQFLRVMEKRADMDSQLKFMMDSIVEQSISLAKRAPPKNVTRMTKFNKLYSEAFNVTLKTMIHERLLEIPELEIYHDVEISQNYFENILALRKRQGAIHVASKMGKEKEHRWMFHMPVFQMELYNYDFENNILTVPLGGFEPPLFQANFPALDLSGLGFSIASSISRLIILEQFVREGDAFLLNSAPTVHWLKKLDFDESKRIWDSYGNSMKTIAIDLVTKLPKSLWTLSNHTFDGELASFVYTNLLKILSDSFAIKVSYNVHELYEKKSSRFFNQQLQGLEQFTPEQLFFINLVSFKCEKYSRAALYRMMKSGPIPSPIAVNILMASSAEFAKSFNCPLNTPMNLFNKINLYHK